MPRPRQSTLAGRVSVWAILLHLLLASAHAHSSSGLGRHAQRQSRGLGKARLPSLASRRLHPRFEPIDAEPIDNAETAPDLEPIPGDDAVPLDPTVVDENLNAFLPADEVAIDAYTPDQETLDRAAVVEANGGLADTTEVGTIDEQGNAAPISAEEMQESISYSQGLPTCARSLDKRCDMAQATSAEVGWLARGLAQGGSPADALTLWVGKLRDIGRATMPTSDAVLGGILKGFFGINDIDPTVQNANVRTIKEEIERIVDSNELDEPAGNTLLRAIESIGGNAAAVPEGEIAITEDLAKQVGDNAFRSDAKNKGVISTTYSFFKLVRRLCQAKAFTMDFAGRTQINNLVASKFELAPGGTQDIVWRLEDELKNLQTKNGGNILSHFKAAWRMRAAVQDAFKAGDGIRSDDGLVNTLRSKVQTAIGIRQGAPNAAFYKLSLDTEVAAWQAFLEPHVRAARTGDARDMYLNNPTKDAIRSLIQTEYGANVDVANQIIRDINSILDSTYGDTETKTLQDVIQAKIVDKLNPGSANVVPEVVDGDEMSEDALVKVMADVTTGGLSTSAIKEFFTANAGKTAIAKNSAEFDSAVMKFADSGAPIDRANPRLKGTYPLTRAGMRKFAERLLDMQEKINAADAAARPAIIDRLATQARFDLGDLQNDYTPSYTSELDIKPISNKILKFRNARLDAMKGSSWTYEDVTRETQIEVEQITGALRDIMETSSKGLAFNPELKQSQLAAEAFKSLLVDRYGLLGDAADVMKEQLLSSGYGSQCINKIRTMLRAAVPYMGLSLIDFYKIPDSEALRDLLIEYQRDALGAIQNGGSP